MSVDKKRVCRSLKTAALALLIICIFALPCVIQARWVDTNAAYQKELAWKLGTMPLMYYECALQKRRAHLLVKKFILFLHSQKGKTE